MTAAFLALLLAAPPSALPPPPAPAPVVDQGGPGRGFPATWPWVSFYGSADKVSLPRLARTFRIINIDADPGLGGFAAPQIALLSAGGRNRVLSYLNVGSCEAFRDYYRSAPPGFVPCAENHAAQRGVYAGYPNEFWMDPSEPEYQKLIVGHVAARLAATGVDGFFVDNLEIVEHDARSGNGPCDARCRQGGLDLIARLRQAFPRRLIVMQNATSDITRLGRAGARAEPFAALIDGVSRESVFAPTLDAAGLRHLQAWRDLDLTPGGNLFFIGSEDYVGSCQETAAARRVIADSQRQRFSPYVSDASAGQQRVCYWTLPPARPAPRTASR
jgi:cysteinyl-tRNA synthetase